MTNPDTNKIRVVLCRPGEYAEVTEIGEDLRSMQEAVGGNIEEYMPFDCAQDETPDDRIQDVAIVCDDEGKLKKSALNRAIYSPEGDLQDIIAGTFFICYAPIASEKFLSLPADLEAKFLEKFRLPEQFFMIGSGVRAVKFDPKQAPTTQEQVR